MTDWLEEIKGSLGDTEMYYDGDERIAFSKNDILRLIAEVERLRGIIHAALEEAYQDEVIDTDMEDSLIGEYKEYADKADWNECRIREWEEEE